MKRTFVAVKSVLSEENFKLFSNIKSNLRDSTVNWVDTENMHLTLFFLGATNEEQIPVICRHLKEELENTTSFSFSLKGLGVFKSLLDPRILWIGIENADKLKVIKEKIDKALIKLDFKVEDREFKPHLTIGRIKYLKKENELENLLDRFTEYKFQEIEVAEVVFYESILTNKGPVYKVIEKIHLVEKN
ncbi:MAG: 2'-5' RNA ligase [Bacteroidetes bacterium GWF2_33_16]|nr:MAG: 2'-5' RNA ligase [Bacteroidetes bacterium GWE2_32_14]OFY06853.1 MAG: 2'-5' RNA ligase [Bacteroidetes bacterium GWF2_33_16]